jgi:FtsH-binding integral membrane protein
LWDSESEECENDVAGLALSFILSQSIRYAVTGVLPNSEGEETMKSHTALEFVLFAFTCLFLAFFSAGVTRIVAHFEFEEGTLQERLCELLNNWTAMTFAWCLLSFSRWVCQPLNISDETMNRVVIALLVSATAFAIMTLLDFLSDGDMTSYEVEKALREIILSLAILVGFSWEQSFDK